MNEIVSIIVPVYNLEKYIARCIDSIINQTYLNIELIIIDDGSTDKSFKICSDYAKSDSRIKIIKNIKKGVSSARNIGIKKSIGKYICFVDGDDYIENEMVEKLVRWIQKSEADIAICGTNDVDENGNILKSSVQKKSSFYSREDFLESILIGQPFTCVSWGKLYRREIIKNTLFDEKIYIAEDLEWFHRMLPMCEKIYFNPEKFYNWTVRRNSALHSMKSEDAQQEVEIVKNIMKAYSHIEFIYDATIQRYINCNLRCLKLANIEKDIEKVASIKEAIRPYIKRFLFNSKIDLKLKIKLLIKLLAY